MTVASYYLTSEDLPDLDSKTRNGLDPLIGQLNTTLTQLIGVVNGQKVDEVREVTIAVDATLDSVFPLKVTTTVRQPTVVVLGNCQPRDPAHSLATPFVIQNWSLTSSGLISIPAITGVLPSNTYDLTLWVR